MDAILWTIIHFYSRLYYDLDLDCTPDCIHIQNKNSLISFLADLSDINKGQKGSVKKKRDFLTRLIRELNIQNVLSFKRHSMHDTT